MNTKLIMTASAITAGLMGILLTFAPAEASAFLGWNNEQAIILQLLGAAYFAFGMINWTAKANLIGGIYGRPIAIGNFTHYVIGALALIKVVSKSYSVALIVLTLIYVAFAVLFGLIFFTHPRLRTTSEK